MPPVPKRKKLAMFADAETRKAHYRHELRRVTGVRKAAAAQTEEAMRETGYLLARGLNAGLPAVEAAQLSELSRPTMYRQVALARQRFELAGLVGDLAEALDEATAELGRPATAAELADRHGVSVEELLDELEAINPVVAQEFDSLGPPALRAFSTLVPQLDEPEGEILRMLLLHGMSPRMVARAVERSPAEVSGWAALGLLRVLPGLRDHSDAGDEGSAASV
jgi:hypothetical protein